LRSRPLFITSPAPTRHFSRPLALRSRCSSACTPCFIQPGGGGIRIILGIAVPLLLGGGCRFFAALVPATPTHDGVSP